MGTDTKTGSPAAPAVSLSYRDAGVDIDAGNALVDNLGSITERTRRPEVLTGLGGFGGLFELPAGYRQPVLVSATDGVGTKLKLAMQLNRHEGVGIDLVAMCVNDLIVCGAEPLFFLDYYATGKLDVKLATDVVAGIGRGCELAGCALIGGETAEMPGMYSGGDYDLAGFAVGVVEKDAIIDQSRVQPGDRLIGLLSSGAHSNGYSLIRRILAVDEKALDQKLDGVQLADLLITPTEIYVKAIRELLQQIQVNAIAHITGGGIIENLPRVLPAGSRAVVERSAWRRPALFDWLQKTGGVSDSEMLRTFNCGIGMIVCVPEADCSRALKTLQGHNRGAVELGHIEATDAGSEPVAVVR